MSRLISRLELCMDALIRRASKKVKGEVEVCKWGINDRDPIIEIKYDIVFSTEDDRSVFKDVFESLVTDLPVTELDSDYIEDRPGLIFSEYWNYRNVQEAVERAERVSKWYKKKSGIDLPGSRSTDEKVFSDCIESGWLD